MVLLRFSFNAVLGYLHLAGWGSKSGWGYQLARMRLEAIERVAYGGGLHRIEWRSEQLFHVKSEVWARSLLRAVQALTKVVSFSAMYDIKRGVASLPFSFTQRGDIKQAWEGSTEGGVVDSSCRDR